MKSSFVFIIIFLLLISCQKPVPRLPIIQKSVSQVENTIAINNKLKTEQELIFKEIKKKDSLSNYYSSKYGFWYKYDIKGNTSYIPKKGDEILYTYKVYNAHNQLIYGLTKKKYWVDKENIIEGLQIGLKLMKQGDQITFLFPSNVAYGFSGDQNKIAVNQPLIFKVKLNKINKNESN
ncbi:gliding motility-associated peptidyl-prolyl isomerase GldI [Lutibacter sp.]|uniref:gliding motility-associated peptidyl-prolyl isomerase GldI n=1 Tax=Lutibacter sp. TaxID=1925666 RepID=UPI0025C07924|nr:gliding motility-associated peptidyl-prolyl isomerase GldI [Lutibacter sp.]MCF6181964.1 gliding motility-associated peptidyl-prolyl isomerase GldI [Lutibacter sp.]